jgi:outer membrane protein OmpA-like peptidoglycan-associated protein
MRHYWIVALALGSALSSASAVAQGRRAVGESEAIAYIHSAFITQADPGVVAKGVVLGPELEKRLGLTQGTNNEKVYAALIGLTGDKSVQVRRATPEEIDGYGKRRGFEPAKRPLFTLRAGDLSLIVHYDLQAANILFVGQLGALDPDPRPVPAPKPEPMQVAAAATQAQVKKDTTVNLVWTGLFEYNSTKLTPQARERLDNEIIPKLMSITEIRYLQVSGHSDRIGTVQYNRHISEKRAEAVREYLVAKGVNPDKIETFGYGQTMPVRPCADGNRLRRSDLIECLAPNRRVVMEIQGRQP